MGQASPGIEAALRRLLIGLERSVHLDEWTRPIPLDATVMAANEERRELPKAA